LESLLQQEFTDFEAVVVDDCSTDNTGSIIKTFADPRIRLIENETNLGLGRNWNKALSYARGKYVKLLCGDDILRPECLLRQVEALERAAYSRVVLAICNRTVINTGNKVVLRRRCPLMPGVIKGTSLIRMSVRWGTNLIGEPAVGLFRRAALDQSAKCDLSNPYAIDLNLWAELLKQGDAFVDAEYLASFRISAKAVSARIGLRQAAYFRKFVRKLRNDPFYRISAFDALSGYVLSFQWCLLRNLFIRTHSNLKQTKGSPSENLCSDFAC
jgi:glycosyltransferase involved in cell wall biosynthesis